MNLWKRFFEIENIELDYYETVIQYMRKVQEEPGRVGWKMAVTGHSLGGGVSTIAGATLGVQSLAFSPPGFARSRHAFDTQVSANETLVPRLHLAAQHTVNFIPMHDLVPKVDDHFGLVQSTMCVHKSPAACHAIEHMVCDLINRCGDGHDGKRFSGCIDISQDQ
jgi:hypothetical protein